MQSSQALRALPVVLCLAPPLVPHPCLAQARLRATGEEWFYQQPGGKRLARILAGTALVGGTTQGDWQAVTLDGWIFLASVGPTARPGFDLAVTRAPEENLRASPGGALLAKLPQGFALSRIGEEGPAEGGEGGGGGRWVHVQRAGWMPRGSLEPVAEVGAAPGHGPGATPGHGPGDGMPDSSAGAVDSSRAQPVRRTTLYRAPDGPQAGMIAPTTPMRVLSRSGDWTRVQFEGWVKSADLTAAPAGVLVGVSAAELRTDPQRYVGQTVRWTVQFIALEKADELRPEIPAGGSYLLVRGPLPERGFAYVLVPDAKRSQVEGLTPLTVIQVTARVRAGRSRYLGNPVVDLLSLEVESQP